MDWSRRIWTNIFCHLIDNNLGARGPHPLTTMDWVFVELLLFCFTESISWFLVIDLCIFSKHHLNSCLWERKLDNISLRFHQFPQCLWVLQVLSGDLNHPFIRKIGCWVFLIFRRSPKTKFWWNLMIYQLAKSVSHKGMIFQVTSERGVHQLIWWKRCILFFSQNSR